MMSLLITIDVILLIALGIVFPIYICKFWGESNANSN